MIERAEPAVADRLAFDPLLGILVGRDETGEVRVYAGWPAEPLERPSAAEFPRITLIRAADLTIRPTVGEVEIQLDLWVWPTGASGGLAALGEIDTRVRQLLDEAHWTYEDARLYAVDLGGRDVPAEPGRPLRRTRRIRVFASPA